MRCTESWYGLGMFLVTGATGFIGRQVIARPCADGVRERALVLPGEDVSGLDTAEIIFAHVIERSSLDPRSRGYAGFPGGFDETSMIGVWG